MVSRLVQAVDCSALSRFPFPLTVGVGGWNASLPGVRDTVDNDIRAVEI